MGGQEFTVRKQLVQSSVKMKGMLRPFIKDNLIAAFSRSLEHQDVIVYVLPKTTLWPK